jgi:hypothetical protein
VAVLSLVVVALPAAAQDDPFRSAAPPTVTPAPGLDPFQMAPADPPPAPKPLRPHPNPEPEPVVATPLPHPTPPLSPSQDAARSIAAYDGDYVGNLQLKEDPNNGRNCGTLNRQREITIKDGIVVWTKNEKSITVNNDGSFKLISSGFYLEAKIKEGVISGSLSTIVGASNTISECGYIFILTKH